MSSKTSITPPLTPTTHNPPAPAHVLPPESKDLSSAHPGGGQGEPQGVETTGALSREEHFQFFRVPDLHLRIGCLEARRIGRVHRVLLETVPADRVFQRPVERRVDAAHRGQGETTSSFSPAFREETGVEGVNARSAELLQGEDAESGNDVAAN